MSGEDVYGLSYRVHKANSNARQLVVLFEKNDLYQGMPSGMPYQHVAHARFSGCGHSEQNSSGENR
jgi:hypothetical protein